jgi:uncharacterized protein (TIGR00255 family)
MTLKSMTGFARTSGGHLLWRWSWELKSVNSKGLDLRLRIPSPFDRVETDVRARISAKLTRGACYATLTTQRADSTPDVRVNEDLLRKLTDALARVPANPALRPASIDGLLNVRGVIEVREAADDETLIADTAGRIVDDLDEAIQGIVEMRAKEGAALGAVLSQRLDRIAALTQAAEDCPGRKPEAVKARLQLAIDALGESSRALDPTRLHHEALLLAAKADIREELDRLTTHLSAGRELVAASVPVGRKLDFLAQEFAREANTLCSKSNDAELTRIGMDLRVEIEQFREQVQNIE